MPRSISTIAYEISKDWKKVNYGAVPYLRAMYSLDNITDMYGMDSAPEIVLRFLGNATSWRGEVAKRVKTELKEILKHNPGRM
jgi:hypothetical protein